jgi:lipopolysaccharide export system protein LptA
MKHHILPKPCFFLLLFLILLLGSEKSIGKALSEDSKNPKDNQMVIESDNLEIDDQQNRVTFTGNVRARGNEFKLTCQRLDLYYQQPKSADPKNPLFNIEKIVASGKVNIIRAEGGSAAAETAVYLQDEGKVVLTGNPRIKQENDWVEGTKITLFLKTKKSVVEGSEKNQVKAVISIPESE